MAADFDLRGQEGRFPATRRSAVAMVGSDDPAEVARGFEVLVRAYWRPVYVHLRRHWRRDVEDARDLTQAFFARAFEKRQLVGFDAGRAKFRTYLRGALDNFALEAGRAERREKRGGGAAKLSLDFDVAEEELARDEGASDASFDAAFTRALFAGALRALEARAAAEKKEAHLAVFRRYVVEPEIAGDLRRPSYAHLACDLGLSVTDVTNYLAWARRTFRELALAELREITATDEEYADEARAILGIDP